MGKGYKIRKNYIKELKEFIERDFKIVATKRNNEIDFSINDHKIKIETWANGTLDSEQTCGYMVYLEDVYYCFYGYGVYDNKDKSSQLNKIVLRFNEKLLTKEYLLFASFNDNEKDVEKFSKILNEDKVSKSSITVWVQKLKDAKFDWEKLLPAI